jgi:hypothetical protein
MHLASHVAAVVAVMGAGVVYGTDVFCAVVQRAALARVDDATLTVTMGNLHRFADRRMPFPGVLGIVGAAASCVLAALADERGAAIAAGIALVLLVVWMAIYLRISAPINRILTAAADRHETPANVRFLQDRWDSVIVLRAVLQGVAIVGLCVSLLD